MNISEQRIINTTLPVDIIDRATEVVKNLQNIFDKLFEILTSPENDLKTRDQEQLKMSIDLNKIHRTAFHAVVSHTNSFEKSYLSFVFVRSVYWI